jgi:hypothetical protein
MKMRNLTAEEFVRRATIIYKGKYDYSQMEYKNAKTPCKVICPEHGPFNSAPMHHLAGHGCKVCKKIKDEAARAEKQRAIEEERAKTESKKEESKAAPKAAKVTVKRSFVDRAKATHPRLDYSKAKYTNMKTKVEISCPKHGPFEQTPEKHLLGQGCPKCKEQRTRETCLQRYGVTNPMKLEITTKKVEQTKEERGVAAHFVRTQYVYQDEIFDSSWELAFWIWCRDYRISIKRNRKAFPLSNGKRCYPDFIVEGGLIEIKGDHLTEQDSWVYKQEFYRENGVQVLFEKDVRKYLDYVKRKYGPKYLKSFKKERPVSVDFTGVQD